MSSPVPTPRHLQPVDVPHSPTADPREQAPANTSENAPGTVDGLRHVRLNSAANVRLRPTYWLWEGRMPQGALTIGPGREGIGKSLFCAWLAARVTLGELPGLHYGQPMGVIYAATEDSWERTIAGRLHAAGADMHHVYQVSVEHVDHSVPLSLPRDCESMAEAIETHGVALLILDPLISTVDERINVNQDRELRGALEPLARLADTTGTTVFGLAHFNKVSGTDVLSRITGSRAFSAVARAAIAFARDTGSEDGSCVLSQAKNNLGSLDVPSLRYTVDSATLETEEGPATWGRLSMLGETDAHVDTLLAEAENGSEDRSERAEVKAWLVDYLTSQGGHARANDVYEHGSQAASYSKDQLKRAKKELGIQAVKSDNAWGWQLPEKLREQEASKGASAE